VRADVFLLAGQFPGISPGQALANTVAYALAAEQAGFTGAWIAEHLPGLRKNGHHRRTGPATMGHRGRRRAGPHQPGPLLFGGCPGCGRP
jgi:alkanesulfonate monooxygenase SsuD/methylene tetrahydromethanopterin reductase-like flavin-dependent oxidoreductase (luciferase family)